MTGREMLSKIVLSINTHALVNNTEVIEAIEINGNLSEAITKLKALAIHPNFVSFLTAVELFTNQAQRIETEQGVNTFLSEPYVITGTPETIDFSLPTVDKKNRSFAHSNTDFSFFSAKMFFDGGAFINLTEQRYDILWNCIQDFCVRCYETEAAGTEPPLIITFLDCIQNNNTRVGFVVNKNGIPFLAEKHYSYIYLHYLNNSNSITLSSDLIYRTPMLNPTLVLDSTKIYEQYFDIYDVLNELNQCTDILNRFLKLYHTLEYLVYRVYLVEMLGRVGVNKIFVREFIGASENMAKSEKASFVRNFQKIFLAQTGQITTALTPHSNAAIIAELSSKNIVKDFLPSQLEKVALLIYGLRCGIVHNKEGEYHLTIANAEDYQALIPLIRQVITTFEELVVFKLKENDGSIHYQARELNLY